MKATALQLRQSLGAILKKLASTGRPILIEKDRMPAAVLISIEDYQKRFVDVQADALREKLVEKIKKARLPLPDGVSSLDLIREIRG